MCTRKDYSSFNLGLGFQKRRGGEARTVVHSTVCVENLFIRMSTMSSNVVSNRTVAN